jgi:hypothetical protein
VIAKVGSVGGARLALLVVALGVPLALVGEIYLSTVAETPPTPIVFGEIGSRLPLAWFLEQAPFEISSLARALSTTLLLLGLASWFWIRAGTDEVTFQKWRECGLFGLLFAISVVGVSGGLDGFYLPVGFLLAVPLAAVAVYLLQKNSIQGKALRNEVGLNEADNLLKSSVELSVLRHRRRTMRAEIRKNEKEPEEVEGLKDKRA